MSGLKGELTVWGAVRAPRRVSNFRRRLQWMAHTAQSPHTAMLVAPSAIQPAFGAAVDPNLARKASPYTFRDVLVKQVNLSSLNISSAYRPKSANIPDRTTKNYFGFWTPTAQTQTLFPQSPKCQNPTSMAQ